MQTVTVVERASAQVLRSVTSMLDEEFVFRKQRTLSFSRRFPGVFCPDNASNTFVVRDQERILSSVTVKRARLLFHRRVLEFAMVGGVCTMPDARGNGLASCILRHLGLVLAEEGVDFAVLWTTSPGFYERLGWQAADNSVFGTLVRRFPKVSAPEVSHGPLVPQDMVLLEAIRACILPGRVIREAVDYQTIPLPAEEVERFAVEEASGWSAYALVGRLNDTGYVYEVVGETEALPSIWAAIGDAYQTVYVNDCAGSPSARWLDTQELVCFTPKNLAMWRIISSRIAMEQIQDLYVPFLDRI